MSGSKIMIFDDMVLKVQPESEETENEYRIMKWLRGKVPVPEVMHYEKEEGMAYLLMTRVQGKQAYQTSGWTLQSAIEVLSIILMGYTVAMHIPALIQGIFLKNWG